MVFLILAIACSTGIAVIFRVTEGRLDRIALLTVNYAVAITAAGGRLLYDRPHGAIAAEPALIGLGLLLGLLFIGGFVLFSYSIGLAGLSLATATMRLSVAVPFLASWWVWGEVPTAAQGAGLVAAGLALVLITRPNAPASAAAIVRIPQPPGRSGGPVLVAGALTLLFFTGGAVDTSLKVFEEEFAGQHSRPFFLLMAFSTAFVIGLSTVWLRGWRSKGWPRRAVLLWGALLGAVNYASVEFLLLALGRLPGTVVFPANNVAIVAAATLLGILVWRERPSRANRAGVALAAIALLLLAF